MCTNQSSPIRRAKTELSGGPSVLKVKTNDAGRAEFSGLAPGTRVKAVTTVDGERLESQAFPVQAQGGVRLMLVATDKEKERQKAEEAKQPAARDRDEIEPLGPVFRPEVGDHFDGKRRGLQRRQIQEFAVDVDADVRAPPHRLQHPLLERQNRRRPALVVVDHEDALR